MKAKPQSLLAIEPLESRQILDILALAKRMNPARPQTTLRGRRIALLFYENSTRTRTSFEIAAKSLGASTVVIHASTTSIEKGESLKDTGQTLQSIVDAIVMRHPSSGAPMLLERQINIPIVNAGDGMHAHPSQALLDAFTILEHKKSLKGLKIVTIGDIFHSRVARSDAHLFSKLGARVIFCGPDVLLPDAATQLAPGLEIVRSMDEAVKDADVVMMLRVQQERLSGMQINVDEYVRRYQLTTARLKLAKPDAIVMHPGPMIRGMEMTDEVADCPQSVVLEQVLNGVKVRMAILATVLAKEKVSAKKPAAKKQEGSNSMSSILLTGGHLIDPAANVDEPRDLLLRDGVVAEVAAPGRISASADEKLELRGLIVAPGFIDLHVHLREPGQTHKESIATGTAAAAAGGFTSVCAMPNTRPINDSPAVTRWMQDEERGAVVNVFPIAAATIGSQGEKLSDYRELQAAGAVAVSDDGRAILDDHVMREALALAARVGITVIQHAEDSLLSKGNPMNEGVTSFRLGLRGQPEAAEWQMVERDIRLTSQEGGKLHVAHVSCARSLEMIRLGRHSEVAVSCEVTPHHFLFTDEECMSYDTRYKMAPPLRTRVDREAMIAALADGTIDAIATDHAPHALYEKEVEFDKAAFGITGLEIALAAASEHLVKAGRISLKRLVELFSTNPAKIVELEGRGTLAKGSVADVTIFDPKKKWTYDVTATKSRSRNCPYDGMSFHGKALATIVGGKLVFSEL